MTGQKCKHNLRTNTFILFQKANYVNFFAKKRSSKILAAWRSACVNATKIIEILDSLKPPPAPGRKKFLLPLRKGRLKATLILNQGFISIGTHLFMERLC